MNGNLDDDNIKTGANINGTKFLANSIPSTALDANARADWRNGILAAPNTITNNGNRNYSVVFNSVDYTGSISNGMRLKLTRTVTAPTQCTDLESSSSNYFTKTTPNKLTFTDDYTVMGWVKLESYVAGGIIARRNADTEGWSLGVNATGQVVAWSGRIAANNSSTTSYQSLPLNKWVHIAATTDLSGTSVLVYIDGVLVPSLTTITGTIIALVQGTTALVVGAEKSAGTNPLDGKLAQAAVFSSVLSAATIASYASQTLSGAESTIASAYSFNGVITDLNTTTPNDLTAVNSAVATNVDSPFAGGANASTAYTAGTTEFGEVFSISFSTNTTIVVQVPDGYAIPTSGGVSAVAYSTADRPLGWPGPNTIIGYAQIASNFVTTSASATQVLGLTAAVTVPTGGRKVRITGFTTSLGSSSANGVVMTLWDGTVGSGTQIQQWNGVPSTSGGPNLGAYITTILTPASGSKTYNVGVSAVTSGTVTFTGGATNPAFISVELI